MLESATLLQHSRILSDELPIENILTDFKAWFQIALKGVSSVRLQNLEIILTQLISKDLESFIQFLNNYTINPISCGLVHEMGERIIKLVDKSELKLTQFNCPMQEFNPACGHPELSGLAHAIFLAERLLSKYNFKRGILLIKEIITLDELVGGLPNSGRGHKEQILQEQRKIQMNIIVYIQELVYELRKKY